MTPQSFHELDIKPLIAAKPAAPRDSSRLLTLNRKTGEISHLHFSDIKSFFSKGDCLVFNDTKVFPARLWGKKPSGGKMEILLLRPVEGQRWLALAQECKPGLAVTFPEWVTATAIERSEHGEWIFEFSGADVWNYARSHGDIPLPKYILKARGSAAKAAAQQSDKNSYQTVYAQTEGSVAAPTAGFHFTPELLDGLRTQGVKTASITLHVGWGTFKMLKTPPQEHKMPPEIAALDADQAEAINTARRAGGRIFSVGTTSTRTLETFSDEHGTLAAGTRPTGLFIYPPYRFKAVDALLTNFHLPDSTPLYLAAAFCGSWDMLYEAYRQAVENKYRFYSYGDAMLIYE